MYYKINSEKDIAVEEAKAIIIEQLSMFEMFLSVESRADFDEDQKALVKQSITKILSIIAQL